MARRQRTVIGLAIGVDCGLSPELVTSRSARARDRRAGDYGRLVTGLLVETIGRGNDESTISQLKHGLRDSRYDGKRATSIGKEVYIHGGQASGRVLRLTRGPELRRA
jgi:hypothetical protein